MKCTIFGSLALYGRESESEREILLSRDDETTNNIAYMEYIDDGRLTDEMQRNNKATQVSFLLEIF